MTLPWLLLDFDSTFVTAESLELLGEIALAGCGDRAERLAEVRDLTRRAMSGRIPFREALARRLELIAPRREHLGPLVAQLRERVSPSFRRHGEFLRAHAGRIYILSSGFHEFIDPVVADFGIAPEHVLANRFVEAHDGGLSFEADNPLAADGGKVAAARALGLDGPAVAVGDGTGDRELAESGVCERFYAFVENVNRAEVTHGAERIAPDFDTVLADLGLAGAGRPRRALLLEGIHPAARDRLEAAGCTVETLPGSPDPGELAERLADIDILGIRSKTHITPDLLDRAPRLLTIGAFCIGTNQIDLPACTRHGIGVFNAPFSNTRSVAELALAEIVLLSRNLPDKIRAMHAGRWAKSAAASHEVRGKTLGIVGYGKIGMQLSVLAEALGMHVRYHDVTDRLALGNAVRCATLGELLGAADVVSLHVDGRAANRNLIDGAALARMKPGALLVNLSRGHVVDLAALDAALGEGRLGGAALDVFPEEPSAREAAFDCALARRANVILTPHIGGSTEEAQLDIARYVSGRLAAYLTTGASDGSVNLPALAPDRPALAGRRLSHLHENVPGMLAAIDRVLAERGLNITTQHLGTNTEVGYVLTDVDAGLDDELLQRLARIPHTLASRGI